jgi:hypothetical protein
MVMSSGNYRNRAELRKHPRRQFHYSAQIFTDPKAPALTCMIADISQSGARLVLENDKQLPDRFMLLLSSNGGARRRCRVVWRTAETVGVEFSSD